MVGDIIRDEYKNIWLRIIRETGSGKPNTKCHQQFSVYVDCRKYGFNREESLDCAYTCDNLPVIVFEVA